jgi:hypothetical protein
MYICRNLFENTFTAIRVLEIAHWHDLFGTESVMQRDNRVSCRFAFLDQYGGQIVHGSGKEELLEANSPIEHLQEIESPSSEIPSALYRLHMKPPSKFLADLTDIFPVLMGPLFRQSQE